MFFHLILLCWCVLCGLPSCGQIGKAVSGRDQEEIQNSKPSINFSGWSFASRTQPGHQVVFDGQRVMIRDNEKIYSYEPAVPVSQALRVYTLPESVKLDQEVVIKDGKIYFQDRTSIYKLGESKPWFKSERPFHSFFVVDRNTVLLIWPCDSSGIGRISGGSRRAFSRRELELAEVRLLEVWNVETNTCITRVNIPSAVLDILDRFKAFPLIDVVVHQSLESLVIFFPALAQIYSYDLSRDVLKRLITPWPEIDLGWMDPIIMRQKDPNAIFYVPAIFFPQLMKASPAEGGCIRFAYEIMPLQENLMEMWRKGPGRNASYVCVPGKLQKTTDIPSEFAIAEWCPGSSHVRRISSSGDPNIEDIDELRRRGWNKRFAFEGIHISQDKEITPRGDFLKILKAAEKKPDVEGEKGKPSAVPAEKEKK